MPSRQQMPPPPAHSSVESGSLQWPSSSGYSPQTYRAPAVPERLPRESNCCKFGIFCDMRSFMQNGKMTLSFSNISNNVLVVN